MIEIELMSAEGKPSDLKICKKCQWMNWCENEICRNPDCGSKKFDKTIEASVKAIKEDYEFYMEEEGMTKEEADRVLIEV